MTREAAYEMFKDAEGNPQLIECCVFYFDLLGIASMSKEADALGHLQRLKPALEVARERAGTEEPINTRASTWFTDNIVMGTPIFRFPQNHEGALLFTVVDMSYLFLHLLEAGFLGRGGIAVGDHYMDEQLVFGSALIDAVELEKTTKSPRIALTQDAAELVRQIAPDSGYGSPEDVPLLWCLACDGDGTVFVDIFGVWFSEEDDIDVLYHFLDIYRTRIEEGLSLTEGESHIHEKWQWFADYFNWTLSGPSSMLTEFRTNRAPGIHSFDLFHKTVRPFA